ncbi:MAG: hypothetical protein EAX96_20585 [Candidatus Lokiarchaeota archaeon]|nr:hypothetical protein [Candidatus Lokiarchaeota archaeon]
MTEEEMTDEDEESLLNEKIFKEKNSRFLKKVEKIDAEVERIMEESRQLEISLDESRVRNEVVLLDKFRELKPRDKPSGLPDEPGSIVYRAGGDGLIRELIPDNPKKKRYFLD